MPHRGWYWSGIAGALLVATTEACGQNAIPKSQLGSVSQVVAGTRIDITYRRPDARGRALFGALVPWGRVWTPSADSAALLTVSAPVTVNGEALAAGSYSIWTIPQPNAWTVIFNTVPHAFHLAYPSGHDALRVRTTPMAADSVETLTFDFPAVDGDSATLRLHWGTTAVPLSIHVRAP